MLACAAHEEMKRCPERHRSPSRRQAGSRRPVQPLRALAPSTQRDLLCVPWPPPFTLPLPSLISKLGDGEMRNYCTSLLGIRRQVCYRLYPGEPKAGKPAPASHFSVASSSPKGDYEQPASNPDLRLPSSTQGPGFSLTCLSFIP